MIEIFKFMAMACFTLLAIFGLFMLFMYLKFADDKKKGKDTLSQAKSSNDISNDFNERILNRLERLEKEVIDERSNYTPLVVRVEDIESTLSDWGAWKTDNTSQ